MSGNVPGAWYSSCVPRGFSATEATPDNRLARSTSSWPPRLGAGHDLRVRLDGALPEGGRGRAGAGDRKSTRLNSSHGYISYAVFCLKKKKKNTEHSSQASCRQ